MNFDKKSTTKIRSKSLFFLAKREHSSWEIKNKLAQAGFNKEQIQQEIEDLKTQNYLSDERFCEMFIRSRKNMGYGPIKIAYELKKHQFSEQITQQYLNEKSETWFDLALKVRMKKFGDSSVDDFKEKARQMRFLQSRGFSNNHIEYAFSR